MIKFFQEIQTLYWWISVVITGLVINLIASFVFKKSEIFSASLSEKRQKKLEEKNNNIDKIISKLVNNPSGKQYIQNHIINLKLDSIRAFIMGAIFYIVPSNVLVFYNIVTLSVTIVAYAIGALIIVIGFQKGLIAYERGKWLDEAAKREKEMKE